jgi:alpha-L-rhamnosidase
MLLIRVTFRLCIWAGLPLLFLAGIPLQAQISKRILEEPWEAIWITGPGPALNRQKLETDPSIREAGVYIFRKQLELSVQPSTFIIHVSADNRYKLFVNGQLVSLGPSRGDLYHWNFETLDIASFLRPGKNIVNALVWNFGALRPEAQISYRTGFILQGNTVAEEILNTNESWKSVRDTSFSFFHTPVPGYYVAGPGEKVNMNNSITGWKEADYDDAGWSSARPLAPGLTRETSIDASGWMLVPSPIPPMEMKPQRMKRIRMQEGVNLPDHFPAQSVPVSIPAHSSVSFLLDQDVLTNAYPTIRFSGGREAVITLGYAESLYIPDTSKSPDTTRSTLARFRLTGKGNRNEVEGKKLIGITDSIIGNGKKGQEFTPLWWRTWRYIQVTIQTKADALVLEDIFSNFTAYPFSMKARFQSSSGFLDSVLQTGWRTARLCAFETYMDCPYYEQLQYAGDTRIQAMVSYFNSGDDRLARQAIEQLDASRIAEGITMSRWPSAMHQQIPTFSLWYIGMVYDYYRYRPDSVFVREKLPGIRQVLNWFMQKQEANGSLVDLPFWNFTDWISAKGWSRGMAPVGKNGSSALLDLQLLNAFQLAAELEQKLGMNDFAGLYTRKARELKKTIWEKYWVREKGVFADTEDRNLFSQHTNTLALLTGVSEGEEAKKLSMRLTRDTLLTKASLYFKYYLHQALVKAGRGEDYIDWLSDWKKNLDLGLTTWAEMADVETSRSDCHAWGSSPNIELFRTVLGIDSDAPGFRTVLIRPHLGRLQRAGGSIPHPAGILEVLYNKVGMQWRIEITLPPGITGKLVWKGRSYPLTPGKNRLNIRS